MITSTAANLTLSVIITSSDEDLRDTMFEFKNMTIDTVSKSYTVYTQ